MIFNICFFISLAIFIAGIALSFKIYKKNNGIKNSFYCAAITVFLSAVIVFLPIYCQVFNNSILGVIKILLLSIHNTIRLFIVDGEFSIIIDYLDPNCFVYQAYSVFAAVLFVLAPVLTFSFVLSFFKNVFSYQKLLLNYNSELCVFSELNEKSLALAKSLAESDKKRFFVFNDVFDNDGEKSFELIDEAKKINSICVKKDITAFKLKMHNKKTRVSFFIIGENDTENIEQCVFLIDKYKNRENTDVYIFSSSLESELLLGSADKGKIKLRRINETESILFHNFYENGEKLFDNAIDCDGYKKISALVLGAGNYGKETLKLLTWLCQMDGYRLYIDLFDKNDNLESELKAECPELLNDVHNGYFDDYEDAQYRINIHQGIRCESKEFIDQILLLKDISFVFVALGNDEQNIKAAYKIRSVLAKSGIYPQIQTIVYSSKKNKALSNAMIFNKEKIDIDFIGDFESTYKEKVLLKSDIEEKALDRHLKWGEEDAFWKYEYNYRSSSASVLHKKMRLHCNIPGADKSVDERNDDEKLILRRLEHRRWNAYMRSEGYSYSELRNDMAKQHNCLVKFSELSLKEQLKDDD